MTLDPPLAAMPGDCLALQYEPGGGAAVRRHAAVQKLLRRDGAGPAAVGARVEFAETREPGYLFGAMLVPAGVWRPTASTAARQPAPAPAPAPAGAGPGKRKLSGRIQMNGVSMVGVEGRFMAELKAGDTITHSNAPPGETRTVRAVPRDTLCLLDQPWTTSIGTEVFVFVTTTPAPTRGTSAAGAQQAAKDEQEARKRAVQQAQKDEQTRKQEEAARKRQADKDAQQQQRQQAADGQKKAELMKAKAAMEARKAQLQACPWPPARAPLASSRQPLTLSALRGRRRRLRKPRRSRRG
jgi:hypothetical protein